MSHAPIVNRVSWKQQATESTAVQSTETPELIEVDPDWLETVEADDLWTQTVHTTRTPLQKLGQAFRLSKGQSSKICALYSGGWMNRTVQLMKVTRCVAPLQWMAHRVGYQLVRRRTNA